MYSYAQQIFKMTVPESSMKIIWKAYINLDFQVSLNKGTIQM